MHYCLVYNVFLNVYKDFKLNMKPVALQTWKQEIGRIAFPLIIPPIREQLVGSLGHLDGL